MFFSESCFYHVLLYFCFSLRREEAVRVRGRETAGGISWKQFQSSLQEPIGPRLAQRWKADFMSWSSSINPAITV